VETGEAEWPDWRPDNQESKPAGEEGGTTLDCSGAKDKNWPRETYDRMVKVLGRVTKRNETDFYISPERMHKVHTVAEYDYNILLVGIQITYRKNSSSSHPQAAKVSMCCIHTMYLNKCSECGGPLPGGGEDLNTS
jgi:hypothetical protein